MKNNTLEFVHCTKIYISCIVMLEPTTQASLTLEQREITSKGILEPKLNNKTNTKP
jgi:hypothetical protein